MTKLEHAEILQGELEVQGQAEQAEPAAQTAKRGKRLYSFLLTFPIMFVLWVVFSGRFDAFHLSLGVISCAAVALASGDLLFPTIPSLGMLFKEWVRFIGYIPWLIYEIFKANLHLLYLSFHPRLLDVIDPHMIRFKSKLTSEVALVTFANSITLTPGTITARLSADGDFLVHAIDTHSGEGLPGTMEEMVGRVFDENEEK